MSVLLSWVLFVHVEFVVRSSLVIRQAVGKGMDVNRIIEMFYQLYAIAYS